MASEPSSTSNPVTPTIGLRKKAQALVDALADEAFNHGELRTAKSRRAENELRAELLDPIYIKNPRPDGAA